MFSSRPLAKKLDITHLEPMRTRIKLDYVTNESNFLIIILYNASKKYWKLGLHQQSIATTK